MRRNELHEESTFSGRSSPRRGSTDQNSRTVRHSSAAKQCGSPTPLVEHTSLSLRIGAPKTETVRGSHPDRVDWKRASERARERSGEMIGVAIETSTSHAVARTRTSQPVREKPSARRTLMHAIAALNCKLEDLWAVASSKSERKIMPKFKISHSQASTTADLSLHHKTLQTELSTCERTWRGETRLSKIWRRNKTIRTIQVSHWTFHKNTPGW